MCDGAGCTGSRTNWFLGVRTRRKHHDQGEGKAHDKGASVRLVRLVGNDRKICKNIGVCVGSCSRGAKRYGVVSPDIWGTELDHLGLVFFG